jgi:peptide deformylase
MHRPLVYYDHPTLRQKAKNIPLITAEIKKLAEDMIDTMIHHNGVGLAGPQIGQLLRIFVIRDEFVDQAGDYQFGPSEVFINPMITNPSTKTVVMPEGCLSIPGIHSDVERPASIHIRYQTLDGETVTEEVTGFRARVMMHENDHLNGTLFIDRLPSDDRKQLEPELRVIKQKHKA